jgi:hypothetical protein
MACSHLVDDFYVDHSRTAVRYSAKGEDMRKRKTNHSLTTCLKKQIGASLLSIKNSQEREWRGTTDALSSDTSAIVLIISFSRILYAVASDLLT